MLICVKRLKRLQSRLVIQRPSTFFRIQHGRDASVAVFGNELANRAPDRAHAVVTEKDADHYLISVRAPLNNKQGADEVCRQFASGGGRAAAAGINELPKQQLAHFIDVLSSYYA